MTSHARLVLQLDKSSPVPLYRQIKNQVREAVDTGTWAVGRKLPSERELFTMLGVSRITVRQAFSELVAEGYLTSAPGRGFFVAARAPAQELDALVSHTTAMRRTGVEPSSRVLACEVHAATPAVARGLGLSPGAEVVYLHRVRLGNAVPLTIQQVWLPHALVPGLADVDFTTASLFGLLRDRYHLRTTRAETVISARLADPDESRELELAEPAIALTVDQSTFDEDDRVVEFSRSVHNPLRLPVRVSQSVSTRPGAASRLARASVEQT
jgi:GntR family transcriptional regulator